MYLDGEGTHSKLLSWLERKSRITVYRSGHQSGVAAAMNFLLEHAKYDLVSRVDADDIVLPFRYRGAIRRIRNGLVDASFSNSILFGTGLKTFPFLIQFPFRISPKLAPYFLMIANPFVQSTMVARNDDLRKVGGYRDALAEDFDLLLRLAAAGVRLERSRGFGVLYRVHEGQISKAPNFNTNVYRDPLVQESLMALELRLRDSKHITTDGNVNVSIREILTRESLGFRLRNRYLGELAEFLVKRAGLTRDRD